jgi:hypothetical protein
MEDARAALVSDDAVSIAGAVIATAAVVAEGALKPGRRAGEGGSEYFGAALSGGAIDGAGVVAAGGAEIVAVVEPLETGPAETGAGAAVGFGLALGEGGKGGLAIGADGDGAAGGFVRVAGGGETDGGALGAEVAAVGAGAGGAA